MLGMKSLQTGRRRADKRRVSCGCRVPQVLEAGGAAGAAAVSTGSYVGGLSPRPPLHVGQEEVGRHTPSMSAG